MTIKEFASKIGVDYKEHRDGTVTIKYKKKYNPKDSWENFTQKLLKPAKRIRKEIDKEFIPDPNNYNYKDWPIVKVKMKFK